MKGSINVENTAQQDSKDVVLMKNNVITKAKFNITTVENRIFQLVMYKLQKKGTGVLECQITIDEFRKIIKNKSQLDAKAIIEILIELRKQSIFFRKTKEEQNKDKKDKKPFSIWSEWGIINGHEYDEETETFTIEASEKVHSLLHDYMKGGYTPVNLSVFFSLSNSYAQRFYDLLRLWSNNKRVITYTISELKELLMLEGKYPRYVDFKRRVITPAIDELNESGVFDIKIKENRKGRSVESISFKVSDLDKRTYFENVSLIIPSDIPEVPPNELNEGVNEGLNDESSTGEESTGDESSAGEEANDNSVPRVEDTKETILPEETFLVKPLHRLVKMVFKGIDFSQGKYYMAFAESEVATQIQDNVEEISLKQWAYFRETLQNKCDTLRKEEQALKQAKALEDKFQG